MELRRTQVSAGEIGADQAHAFEVRMPQIGTCEVDAGKVVQAEPRTGQLLLLVRTEDGRRFPHLAAAFKQELSRRNFTVIRQTVISVQKLGHPHDLLLSLSICC